MSKSGFVEDGYCGLYCAACPEFQATKRGESADSHKCQGCKSEVVTAGWCSSCTLKKCAREKGIEFCFLCDDYPCADIDNFKNDPAYPYHMEVYDYMETIKTKGKETWLKEMEKRWSCSSCGSLYGWWTVTCPKCGEKTRGYNKPSED